VQRHIHDLAHPGSCVVAGAGARSCRASVSDVCLSVSLGCVAVVTYALRSFQRCCHSVFPAQTGKLRDCELCGHDYLTRAKDFSSCGGKQKSHSASYGSPAARLLERRGPKAKRLTDTLFAAERVPPLLSATTCCYCCAAPRQLTSALGRWKLLGSGSAVMFRNRNRT
jgi:hypothetical protein